MDLPYEKELYAGVKRDLAIDDAQLAELLGENSRWPRASTEDGWVLSHAAIRLDLKDLGTALAALRKFAETPGLKKWQALGLNAMVKEFIRQVTNHHDQEENIYFPFVTTRFKVPEKISVDHKTLVVKLTELEERATAVKGDETAGGDSPALAAFGESLAAIDTLLQEHLREEEVEMLPRIRHNFTREEMGATIKAMHKGLKPSDLGWLLRPKGTDDAKRKWLSETSMPWAIAELVIWPAVKGYGKEAQARLDELVEGVQKPHEGGCSLM